MKQGLLCSVVLVAATVGCTDPSSLGSTQQHLDDDEDLGGGNEPPGPSDEHEKLFQDAAEKIGFKPSDPSTWSARKKIEICQIYADELVAYYGTILAGPPAFTACMENREVDLGMWAYQTLEMRRAGFMPTKPTTWTSSKLDEVCEIPANLTHARLVGKVLGSTATKYRLETFGWCRAFGEGVAYEHKKPPTKWEYAEWEFRWWKKHGYLNWGADSYEPSDGTDLEPPK